MRRMSVIFRLSHSSQTRIPQIDNGPRDFARNLLPTHFASEGSEEKGSDWSAERVPSVGIFREGEFSPGGAKVNSQGREPLDT